MNKKGFTLIELMVVILLISIASVSSIISFSNINDMTKEKDKTNLIIELQKSAMLYFELNDTDLKLFYEACNDKDADNNYYTANDYIYINYSELASNNYIKDSDYKKYDEFTNRGSWVVKIFYEKENDKIDTKICKLKTNEITHELTNEMNGLYNSDGSKITNDEAGNSSC